MKNNKIRVINDAGEEKEFDPLFTFESDETKKSYIVYTDHEKDLMLVSLLVHDGLKSGNPKEKYTRFDLLY